MYANNFACVHVQWRLLLSPLRQKKLIWIKFLIVFYAKKASLVKEKKIFVDTRRETSLYLRAYMTFNAWQRSLVLYNPVIYAYGQWLLLLVWGQERNVVRVPQMMGLLQLEEVGLPITATTSTRPTVHLAAILVWVMVSVLVLVDLALTGVEETREEVVDDKLQCLAWLMGDV